MPLKQKREQAEIFLKKREQGVVKAWIKEKGYGFIERTTCLGRVIHATRMTAEQTRILRQLKFPTPAQLLAQLLAPLPLG